MDAHRPEIEARLKEALAKAKAAYEAAKIEYDRLMTFTADLGNTHPDGATALRSAVRQRQIALLRYNEALHTLSLYRFNRFILDQEHPDDPDAS